jgi:hypothetical protein
MPAGCPSRSAQIFINLSNQATCLPQVRSRKPDGAKNFPAALMVLSKDFVFGGWNAVDHRRSDVG